MSLLPVLSEKHIYTFLNMIPGYTYKQYISIMKPKDATILQNES